MRRFPQLLRDSGSQPTPGSMASFFAIPVGVESITGYEFEPWHFRYVGVPLATEIEESGLTLDELTGIEGGDYLTSETLPPSGQRGS